MPSRIRQKPARRRIEEKRIKFLTLETKPGIERGRASL